MLLFIVFTHLRSFFLELLDGTLVNATALIDQMASGGRFARVDVANDDNVDMDLFLTHDELIVVALSCSDTGLLIF